MDRARSDAWTRTMAGSASRRNALRAMTGGALAGAFAGFGRPAAARKGGVNRDEHDWSGVWDAKCGGGRFNLHLDQKGDRVTGHWRDSNGRGTIQGELSNPRNAVLSGSFKDPSGLRGTFTFKMESDGETFHGSSVLKNGQRDRWKGER